MVRVRIRFSVWLVSGYAHISVLLSVSIVTLSSTEQSQVQLEIWPFATFCSTGLNNEFNSSVVFFLSSFFAILSNLSFSNYKSMQFCTQQAHYNQRHFTHHIFSTNSHVWCFAIFIRVENTNSKQNILQCFLWTQIYKQCQLDIWCAEQCLL